MSRVLPLVLLLAACEADDPLADATPDDSLIAPGDDERPSIKALPSFFVDVEPGSSEIDGRVLLPQRFGPYLDGSGFALVLTPAVHVTGTLRGQRLTPWATATGTVPRVEAPVEASVLLRDRTSGTSTLTRSDAQGRYDTLVVPGFYDLVVVPDTTATAAHDEPVQLLDDDHRDLVLPVGAPLWGRVRDGEGAPVPAAVVSAVRDDGIATATTRTDEAGWYEIRVDPGTWRLVVAEPPGDRLPTLLGGWTSVGAEGLRIDVEEQLVERSIVRLRATHDDLASRDTTVRITATSIDGYAIGTATYALETRTDSQGVVELRLPDGIYTVEVLPGQDDRLAPVRLDDLRVDGDEDLGDVVLPGFEAVRTRVVDADGQPLARAAARCAETLGLRRTWVAEADDDGLVRWELPRAPLACVIQPPGDRLDLAAARFRGTGPEELDAVVLDAGTPIDGIVTIAAPSGTVPGAFAIVRIVDEDGAQLGAALAGEDGRFEVRVDGTR